MALTSINKCENDLKRLFESIETGDENNLSNILNHFNDEEKLSILLTNYIGFNCFHLCCKNGNLGLLAFLLNIKCLQSNKKTIIDLPTKDGDTCLLLACSKGYNDMAAYLIFSGADVNKQNNFGRSALHYCALINNLELFALLIKYEANLNAEDALKSTPLFVAAYHGNSSIVEYMVSSNLCSREEYIESFELLGCALVQLLKFNSAIHYWNVALDERSKEPIMNKKITHKPNISYLYEQEFLTKEELNKISMNHKKMVLQSILIIERIYGNNHLIALKYLSESAFYFERIEEYDLAILLIVNKIKNQNNSQIVAFLNTYDSFHKLLVLLMKRRHNKIDNTYCVNFFIVFELFAKQLKQNLVYLTGKLCSMEKNFKEFDDTLILLGCYIIFFASEAKSGNFDYEIMHKIKSIIYNLIKYNLKCFITGYTILHLALSTKFDSLSNISGSYNVVKLLLECGASSMELDSCKNTSLHIIMALPEYPLNERLEIIKILLDSGAHLDARNENGKLPTDFIIDKTFSVSTLYSNINTIKYFSLKCFAAQAIKKHNIKYKGVIPASLEHFVSFH